jgi:hypothetical protein
MHSFTSSFSARQPRTVHIALLLALCALFCVSLETITTRYFARVSRTERRREAEYNAALAIRSRKADHKLSVLVAGNSVLLQGVDFPALERSLGPDLEVKRSVFENTSFLDWYYGLSRYFRAGSRPDVVVLVLTPWQLVSDATDGDYTVQMMVDGRDLLRFANETGADRNRMSGMALDKASFFFGTRAEIRTWILNTVLPDLPSLTQFFRFDVSVADNHNAPEVASQRLNRLRKLCDQYGVKFVLVVPPSREDSGVTAIADAAAAQGVSALIPIRVLPKSDYADLVHLNTQGAAKFTPALAESLRQILLTPPLQMPARISAPTLPGNTAWSSATLAKPGESADRAGHALVPTSF